MPIYRHWTVKRLENVVRVREYVEHCHYEGDAELTDSVRMTQEIILATRELGDFMVAKNIEEFGGEEEMDRQAQLFA